MYVPKQRHLLVGGNLWYPKDQLRISCKNRYILTGEISSLADSR